MLHTLRKIGQRHAGKARFHDALGLGQRIVDRIDHRAFDKAAGGLIAYGQWQDPLAQRPLYIDECNLRSGSSQPPAASRRRVPCRN